MKLAEAVPAAVPQARFTDDVAAPAPVPAPKVQPAVASPPVKTLVAQAEALASAPLAMISTAAHHASAELASFLPHKAAPAARPKPHVAAVVHHGDAKIVMQIGAYGSPQQVSAGWNRLTQRYPALRAYLPLRARFDSAKGTFWRLSVQGFGTQREAIARCEALKSRGANCFVRGIAGDKPVEIASN